MSVFDWLSEESENKPITHEQYEKSVNKILKKIDNSLKKGEISRTAWLYQMASVLARRARQWVDGVHYAVLAAQYCEREGKRFNAGWSYRSAAIASKMDGDFYNAVNYAVKGADSFLLSKSSYAAKWCYQIAAEASEAANELGSALKFLEKAYRIEADENTEAEIIRIKNAMCHPTIDQYADKTEATEYEPVKFEVVVENHGKTVINDIVVGDKDATISHEIKSLGPGSVKIFAYKSDAKLGWMHSPYNFITWKGQKGEVLSMEIEPAKVLVRPKLQINSYISPGPTIKKAANMVILVKNLSSQPLFDVKVDATFSNNIIYSRITPDHFEKINPGDEKGTDWKIKANSPGEHSIAVGNITLFDEDGVKFASKIPNISADVLEQEPRPKITYKQAGEYKAEKKHFDKSITPNSYSEEDFLDMHKKLYHQQRGFTLRKVGLDVVRTHVENNCKDMSVVSSSDIDHEKVLVYSFNIEDFAFFLTVVIKQDEDFVHLIFKLYGENEKSIIPALERIINIIMYSIKAESDASEVERVEIKKVINIIDSVVQRSRIGTGNGAGKETENKTVIKDSVVQRTGV